MKVLWIILLGALVWNFTKLEVTNEPEYDFFLFSDWTMTWPIYACNLSLCIVYASFPWAFVELLSGKLRENVKLMAWIISFRIPWFILTCNMTFFRIPVNGMGVIPIGYDAVMFVLLGLVVLKATVYEQ